MALPPGDGAADRGRTVMSEKEYSVSEAVRLVGVESHVLRYWEDELGLGIRRNAQGHRIYSEENISALCRAKELKERGLQLKAIRLLLDEQKGGSSEDGAAATLSREQELERQIREFAEEAAAREAPDTQSGAEEAPELCYEVVLTEKQDKVYQFEQIMRRLMEEVVSEQNDRLEKAIADRLKEELEDYCLQYHQMMQEAAAALETSGKRPGRIRRMLEKLFSAGWERKDGGR